MKKKLYLSAVFLSLVVASSFISNGEVSSKLYAWLRFLFPEFKTLNKSSVLRKKLGLSSKDVPMPSDVQPPYSKNTPRSFSPQARGYFMFFNDPIQLKDSIAAPPRAMDAQAQPSKKQQEKDPLLGNERGLSKLSDINHAWLDEQTDFIAREQARLRILKGLKNIENENLQKEEVLRKFEEDLLLKVEQEAQEAAQTKVEEEPLQKEDELLEKEHEREKAFKKIEKERVKKAAEEDRQRRIREQAQREEEKERLKRKNKKRLKEKRLKEKAGNIPLASEKPSRQERESLIKGEADRNTRDQGGQKEKEDEDEKYLNRIAFDLPPLIDSIPTMETDQLMEPVKFIDNSPWVILNSFIENRQTILKKDMKSHQQALREFKRRKELFLKKLESRQQAENGIVFELRNQDKQNENNQKEVAKKIEEHCKKNSTLTLYIEECYASLLKQHSNLKKLLETHKSMLKEELKSITEKIFSIETVVIEIHQEILSLKDAIVSSKEEYRQMKSKNKEINEIIFVKENEFKELEESYRKFFNPLQETITNQLLDDTEKALAESCLCEYAAKFQSAGLCFPKFFVDKSIQEQEHVAEDLQKEINIYLVTLISLTFEEAKLKFTNLLALLPALNDSSLLASFDELFSIRNAMEISIEERKELEGNITAPVQNLQELKEKLARLDQDLLEFQSEWENLQKKQKENKDQYKKFKKYAQSIIAQEKLENPADLLEVISLLSQLPQSPIKDNIHRLIGDYVCAQRDLEENKKRLEEQQEIMRTLKNNAAKAGSNLEEAEHNLEVLKKEMEQPDQEGRKHKEFLENIRETGVVLGRFSTRLYNLQEQIEKEIPFFPYQEVERRFHDGIRDLEKEFSPLGSLSLLYAPYKEWKAEYLVKFNGAKEVENSHVPTFSSVLKKGREEGMDDSHLYSPPGVRRSRTHHHELLYN